MVCSQSAASANGCAACIKQGEEAALEVTGQNVTAYSIIENMVSVHQAHTAQRENNY